MLADRIVIAQHLEAAQHQLAEIDHAFALALVFVELVDLDFLARFVIARHHHVRAQPLFLVAGDEPLHLLERKALVVDAELLVQPLDGRKLVLRIEDLERGGQIGQLAVRAQEAVAQAVESADPHAAHIERQHAGQARHHLARRLVGEGHRQHAAGRDLAGLQQPGDARGQHPRLAGTGTGQDQRVLGRQGDGGALLRIQVL